MPRLEPTRNETSSFMSKNGTLIASNTSSQDGQNERSALAVDKLRVRNAELGGETPGFARDWPTLFAVARRAKETSVNTNDQPIEAFLAGSPHAVVGASRDRSKYGNKVLRAYLQHGRPVFPVNPSCDMVEDLPAFPNLAALPASVHGISVITPPEVTEAIVEEAGQLGIQHIWMQPGAESPAAVTRATELGMNVIAGGPCLLVLLGYREV